jgi:hypothetical protein
VAALRCVLEKRPGEALGLLQRYDKSSQELLLALLQVAAPLGEGDLGRASPQEAAVLLDRLNALAQALRARAPFTVDKICFCRAVWSFGAYEPLPNDCQFRAGTGELPGERVLVYAEVRNFASRPRDNFYETCLAGTLEILDFHGRLVTKLDLRCVDLSLTPRQDCFIKFQFPVPPKVPPGQYTLRVWVRNEGGPAPRVAAPCTLDFRVTAAGSRGPAAAPRDGRADE